MFQNLLGLAKAKVSPRAQEEQVSPLVVLPPPLPEATVPAKLSPWGRERTPTTHTGGIVEDEAEEELQPTVEALDVNSALSQEIKEDENLAGIAEQAQLEGRLQLLADAQDEESKLQAAGNTEAEETARGREADAPTLPAEAARGGGGYDAVLPCFAEVEMSPPVTPPPGESQEEVVRSLMVRFPGLDEASAADVLQRSCGHAGRAAAALREGRSGIRKPNSNELVETLLQRFPDASEDSVQRALRENQFHAGRAARALQNPDRLGTAQRIGRGDNESRAKARERVHRPRAVRD